MNAQLPQKIVFVQGEIFYPMIVTFMTALIGIPAVFDQKNPMGLRADQGLAIEGKVHTVLRVSLGDVHQLATAGKIGTPQMVNSLCCMLANTAYESLQDSQKTDKSEEFEFFRHVRNASSHGNTFNFSDKEPSRPASWRGVVIDHRQKGKANSLFGKPCYGGLLASADAILLLWDIEQKLKSKRP